MMKIGGGGGGTLVGKYLGKRRNCSLRAISPFPTVFSKGSTVDTYRPGLVWERVKSLSKYAQTESICRRQINTERMVNIVGKEKHADNQHFHRFPQCIQMCSY